MREVEAGSTRRASSAAKKLEQNQGFVDHFVQAAAQLPQVREVLIDQAAGFLRVCTVIEAEPFDDSPRDAIYQAELAALDAFPEVSVDFDLVNLTEYPSVPPEMILPLGAQIRFVR